MPPPRRAFATVVSGVPRSGTSLMMQMLRAGGLELLADELRPPDAHNPRGYFEYAPVKRSRRDLSWLDAAGGRAVKVVHALVPLLPPDRAYRVILMRRRWTEVVASQRAMLVRPDLAEEALDEERLAGLFEAQLGELEDWARRQPDVALLRVDHAALLADPATIAAALDGFLGGGLDRAAMAAAVDPSLWRQRA